MKKIPRARVAVTGVVAEVGGRVRAAAVAPVEGEQGEPGGFVREFRHRMFLGFGTSGISPLWMFASLGPTGLGPPTPWPDQGSLTLCDYVGRRSASLSAADTRTVLDQLKVPVITLDPGMKAAAKLPTIGAANWLGARLATKHLIMLGHRRVAVITGSKGGLLCSRARLDGYRAALEEAGIAEDPTLIEHGEFEYRSGVTAARQLITRADPPTAIFAFSDHLALGVYEAARASGLSIPDQLSVVGFDDLPAAHWASPPLTTLRQPLEEMGSLAARTILNLARRKTPESPRMELSTRLVERASTAPPARFHRR